VAQNFLLARWRDISAHYFASTCCQTLRVCLYVFLSAQARSSAALYYWTSYSRLKIRLQNTLKCFAQKLALRGPRAT
jgi:hypothetical protein